MTQSGRLYPARPILAVSLAVFRERRVLIARRAKPPFKGAFSLPGGVVEVGESLAQAAARELMEEVGVEAAVSGFARHLQSVERDGERIRSHYVIAVFAARWVAGEPRLSAEVDEIAWVDPLNVEGRLTTPDLPEVLADCAQVLKP